MSKYAVYQDTPSGRVFVRFFNWQSKWHRSVRAASAAYHAKYPDDHKNGKLYIAGVRGEIEGEQLEIEKP